MSEEKQSPCCCSQPDAQKPETTSCCSPASQTRTADPCCDPPKKGGMGKALYVGIIAVAALVAVLALCGR